MNRAIRASLTIAAASAAAIVCSGPVAAHSGEWGVFLDPARSAPGGSVHLRGDLPSTGPIEIVLVGAGSTGVPLATVEDAPNGHFETIVTFPPDVAPGVWAVEARIDGMQAARTDIELLAAPPPGPDEEAPAPPAVTTSPVSPDPLASRPAMPSPVDGIDVVPFAAAALAVVALAALLLRTRRATAAR